MGVRWHNITTNLPCMEKHDDKRQQLIGQVLAAPAGTGPADAPARALDAWRRLAAHLCPLVGEAGFCALYARAVRLAPGDWPAVPLGARSVEALLATLAETLAAADPPQAGAANAALLETFTKLLSGLIGEALTARLLNTAWAERPDGKRT
jgi:hypothetical protein